MNIKKLNEDLENRTDIYYALELEKNSLIGEQEYLNRLGVKSQIIIGKILGIDKALEILEDNAMKYKKVGHE